MHNSRWPQSRYFNYYHRPLSETKGSDTLQQKNTHRLKLKKLQKPYLLLDRGRVKIAQVNMFSGTCRPDISFGSFVREIETVKRRFFNCHQNEISCGSRAEGTLQLSQF